MENSFATTDMVAEILEKQKTQEQNEMSKPWTEDEMRTDSVTKKQIAIFLKANGSEEFLQEWKLYGQIKACASRSKDHLIKAYNALFEDEKNRKPGQNLTNKKRKLDTEQDEDKENNPNEAKKQKFKESQKDEVMSENATIQEEMPEGCDTVFVGNISTQTQEKTIRDKFETCGEIKDIRFVTRRGAQQATGKAFIQYSESESVKNAVKLNGTEIDGFHILVDFESSKLDKKGGCFNCGEPGHFSRSCKQPLKTRKFIDTNDHYVNNEEYSVFVGNIPKNAQEDDVQRFFKACGKIHSVRVLRYSDSGKSQRRAFVEFEDETMADLALQLSGSTMKCDDQTRFYKKSTIKVNMASQKPGGKTEETEKMSTEGNKNFEIFVSNLNFKTNEQALRTFFGECGEITNVSIPLYSDSQKPRGIAFINFSQRDSVNKALKKSGEKIDDWEIKVSKAKPKTK